jgi:hypothetical protein
LAVGIQPQAPLATVAYLETVLPQTPQVQVATAGVVVQAAQVRQASSM